MVKMASWALLLLLVPVLAVPCPYVLLKHGLSECSPDGTRTASFYWENCTDPLPPPVTGLQCDLECSAGYYLGLDDSLTKSACRECPENTFSEGGATYFLPGMWKEFQQTFNSRCYLIYGKRISAEEVCPRWDSVEDGRYLITGQATDEHWYETVLEGNFHLFKRGKLSLRYRKVTAWLQSTNTGVFSILIRGDSAPVNYTDSDHLTEWKEYTQVLEPGDYNVEISCRLLFIGEASTRCEIQWLTVAGTSLADLSCQDCESGYFSHPAATTCYQCPVNSYYETHAKSCYSCEVTKYSPAGSVGSSSCRPRGKCTARDYTATVSPCKAGKWTRTYEWVQPQICDKEGAIQLPTDEELSCELCLPGYFHAAVSADETVCRACADGFFSTARNAGDTCEPCPAGHYAAKVLNYTIWTPFPSEISNECRTTRGEECTFNTGWIPSLFTLTTGTMHESGIELVLTRYVNIVHKSATVSFQYTLDNSDQGGRLEFLINNRITKEYKTNVIMGHSGEIPLQVGYHKLSWVYYHPGPGSDIAYLHYVTVEGSDEGGAASCLPCPAGYWSDVESTVCTACPAGHSSAPGSSKCTQCSELEFAPEAGGICTKCPDNTVSNPSRTACQYPQVLSFGVVEVPVWELSRASTSPVLCASTQSKLFCKGAFYGPVLSPAGNKYYLSVINPEHLDLVDHVSVDDLPYGYAYALVSSSTLNFSTAYTSDREYFCIQGEDLVLANLGSRVESIAYEKDVLIRYFSGALCSRTGRTFSSEVALECDSSARDGWPSVLSESECHIAFRWKTRYACPICTLEQTQIIKSACSGGRRQVTLREPRDCVLVEVNRDEWEDCNEVIEILGKWQTYAALAAILAVLGTTIVLVYCYCNVKNRYVRLVEVKMGQPK